MIFDGAIDAWRNVQYDAAALRMEKRISDRSVPIIGGLWASLKMGVNYATSLVRVPAGMIFGAEKREVPQPVPVPEPLGKELGENLTAAFQQDCEVAKAKAEGWKCWSRLKIVEGKQHFSNAKHVSARADAVTLPEERSSGIGGLGISAAALGSLVASTPNGGSGVVDRVMDVVGLNP